MIPWRCVVLPPRVTSRYREGPLSQQETPAAPLIHRHVPGVSPVKRAVDDTCRLSAGEPGTDSRPVAGPPDACARRALAYAPGTPAASMWPTPSEVIAWLHLQRPELEDLRAAARTAWHNCQPPRVGVSEHMPGQWCCRASPGP